MSLPFTPYHFGPGIAIKAVLGRRVSLCAFVLINVAIDVEVLYYAILHERPVHRFFHTFLGATVLILAMLICWQFATRFFFPRFHKSNYLGNFFRLCSTITTGSIAMGLFLGAYSHVLLDGLMHYDVISLAPFFDQNIVLGFFSHSQIYNGCVLAGIAGLCLLAIKLIVFAKKKQ